MPFCKSTQESKHNVVALLFKLSQILLCFRTVGVVLSREALNSGDTHLLDLISIQLSAILLDFEETMKLSFVIIIVSSTDVLERNRCPQISLYLDPTEMKWQRPDFRFHSHFSIIGCLKIKIIQHYNLLWHLLNMKCCLKHDALPFK